MKFRYEGAMAVRRGKKAQNGETLAHGDTPGSYMLAISHDIAYRADYPVLDKFMIGA